MHHLTRFLTGFSAIIALCAATCAGADSEDYPPCTEQAEHILSRLQSDVVGALSPDKLERAQQIILDVCSDRQEQVETELAETIQQVREEEQARAEAWWTESADKPGNKRLKRKGH